MINQHTSSYAAFKVIKHNYYSTTLVIVQKAYETSTNIPLNIVQLVIVQYRVHAHPVTLVVFFQVTERG